MIKHIKQIISLLLVLLLLGCSAASDKAVLKDRLLLWHDWSGAEAAQLQALIDDFTTLNPNSRVIVVSQSADEAGIEQLGTEQGADQPLLIQPFTEQARLGLGPDMLIGPSDWVRELADAGLIQDLSGRVDDTSSYLSSAVETVRYQPPGQSAAGLYGLPLTLETVALYYNKTMITTPADTLDMLLLQAEAGQKVAFNSSFESAFWGVQAFGGQLMDEEGRVLLDQGGFTNWLNWLKTAQIGANIILEDHQPTLETLFKQGDVAYIVGPSDILPDLQAALGEDAVGVAPLPSGPNQPAGPFLHTEAAMVNVHASDIQTELAVKLAQFLANIAQQTQLMRQTNMIPANGRVRVDPQVYPVTDAYLTQAKTAVPFPNLPQMDLILEFGDDVYLQTLTDIATPNEAVQTLTNRVNESYGFEPIEFQLIEASCSLSGELEMWHRWPDSSEGTALQALADDFVRRCPAASVSLRGFETSTLRQQYQAAGSKSWGPDLVIGPSDWVAAWANDTLIAPLSGAIEAELLQQYNATAITAMQSDRSLYGLPLWINLMTLYSRTDIVTDPLSTVDEMLSVAGPSQRIALPIDSYRAAWGAFAFGGVEYDEAYNLTIVPDGMVAWLTWLQEAHAHPDIILSTDYAELQTLFISGEAGYYAGDASDLNRLQQAIGSSILKIAPLPAGPEKEARSKLVVEGVMMNPATLASEEQAALALEFASFITSQESQEQLMRQIKRVPSHINVDTTDYPIITDFVRHIATATVWLDPLQANAAHYEETTHLIDTLYQRVVFDNEDPTELVNELMTTLRDLEERVE